MIKGYEPVDALSKAVNFVVKDNGMMRLKKLLA